jgi:hypothetical protein
VLKWKKLGLIFNPWELESRPGWLHSFAQAPCTLLFKNTVRVYFSCRAQPDDSGQYVSYSAFVDLDRSDLTKIVNIADEPVLPLGELGTFDEFGTYPLSVIRTDDGILGYYAGWSRCESVPFNTAIGVGRSYNNGKTFEKLGPGPALPYSYDEPFVISGPKIRKFNSHYQLFYIAGRKWLVFDGKAEPTYKIRMATSSNGLDWTPAHRDLIPNVLGEHEAQASPDVFEYGGVFHMFFCYRQPSDFRRNPDRSYRIGYARSADLLNWHRDDDFAGMDVSVEGWDSEMQAYPHVFELDGEIYMLYLGNEVGKYGFGLAHLETGLA